MVFGYSMYIKVILIVAILLPLSALALDMPSNEIVGNILERKEKTVLCAGEKLKTISELSELEAFKEYSYEYDKLKRLEVEMPYSVKLYHSMYEKFESELLGDEDVWKREYSTSEKIVWHVPDGSSDAFSHWASDFYREKQRIEKGLCKLEWYKDQVNKNSDMPSKFIEKYNYYFHSLNEIDGRCNNPNQADILIGEEAKDYIDCQQKHRVERNLISREFSSYRRLRKRYESIIESQGISNQCEE